MYSSLALLESLHSRGGTRVTSSPSRRGGGFESNRPSKRRDPGRQGVAQASKTGESSGPEILTEAISRYPHRGEPPLFSPLGS